MATKNQLILEVGQDPSSLALEGSKFKILFMRQPHSLFRIYVNIRSLQKSLLRYIVEEAKCPELGFCHISETPKQIQVGFMFA